MDRWRAGELQVISGAFNAEYGQAKSGIINIITIEGTNDFGGSMSVYAGDHFISRDDIFLDIDSFNPVSTRNFEASLHGPLIKDKLFYFVNGRFINRGGAIQGQRRFLPTNILDDFTQNADGTFTLVPLDPSSLGDNDFVDMTGSEELFTQAKLVWRISPALKFSYNYLRNNRNFREFGISNERSFILNPDGAIRKSRIGNTHIAKFTQLVSSRVFYDIGVSFFSKTFESRLFDDLEFQRDRTKFGCGLTLINADLRQHSHGFLLLTKQIRD